MTQRLYDDSMLFKFEARVTSCKAAGKKYEVTLDRSAFFPEGGGQEGDVGTIGGVKVMDTFERDGEVIHLCSAPLETDTLVVGEIDEDVRLRRMQNHSGEHLLMGFIHNKLGYDNVGFHLGKNEVLLDLNGVISQEDIEECEHKANEAIARNVPITISYPDSAELANMTYRSKLEMTENVRIVTIEGIDVCACCAPHVTSTGGIGIVKVISSENIKDGTRLHILSGLSAFELIKQRMDSAAAISQMLSAKPERIAEFVEKLLDEKFALKKQITDIERKKAAEIIDSMTNESGGSFCVFTDGLSRDVMREIANKAVELTDGAAGVFGVEENGYGYIIASRSLPLRSMARDINKALGGKGGGSDEMIQGSVAASREAIEKYFTNIK